MAFVRHQDAGTGLVWYSFDTVPLAFQHAILTRKGGTSEAPWASLSFGNLVGDDPDAVQRNLEIIAHHFDFDLKTLYSPAQVHGVNIGQISRGTQTQVILNTDALITNVPGVTLKLCFADCVPVLFYDAIHHAAALTHAGWRGVAGRIVPATVHALQQAYGTQPADLWAGIGPAIGVDHYIVGKDVADQVQHAAPLATQIVTCDSAGNVHLNLEGAVEAQLRELGVGQISASRTCTACHTDEWYSHRQENGKTGRFGVFVRLC